MKTTIIIDTVNQLQNDLYLNLLKNKGRANFDDWKDFGVEVMNLFYKLRTSKTSDGLPIIPVLILGHPGTGKTVGGSKLNPETNVWLNADKKPLSFFGARGKYSVSKANYGEPNTYEEVIKSVETIASKCTGVPLVVFLLCHVDVYKGETGEPRERLKTIGKMASRFDLEGQVIHCYYTQIDKTFKPEDPKRYKLIVHNTGSNTARSPQGYFKESTTENDYSLILKKIYQDYGINVGE